MEGIYKWTSPSGKSYIGQSQDLEKRKYDFTHRKLYTSKNEDDLSYIDRARRKYNDFTKWEYSILELCNTDDLNEREKYWINKEKTYLFGYNSTTGGDSNTCFSDDAKNKLSTSLKDAWVERKKKNYKHPFKGKHHSNETREKISETLKGHIPWNKGKHNAQNFYKKRIIAYQNGVFFKIYESITEAAKELGIVRSSIDNILSGRSKKTKNNYTFNYY